MLVLIAAKLKKKPGTDFLTSKHASDQPVMKIEIKQFFQNSRNFISKIDLRMPSGINIHFAHEFSIKKKYHNKIIQTNSKKANNLNIMKMNLYENAATKKKKSKLNLQKPY